MSCWNGGLRRCPPGLGRAGKVMKRQIDILFSTHNGQRTLPQMFAALAAQAPPVRPWRIIAINNGSTDATQDILSDWLSRLPLEIHRCAQPGKVKAQQFAAHLLEGDLVILTDDDILPDADWLQQLEAAADANPQAAIFGGTIDPTPIDDVGPWFAASETYHVDLFARARGPAGPVKGADTIFGPNMMIRLPEAQRALAQASALGPSSSQRKGKRVFPLGDETEMIALLERAGSQAIFVPEARVGHMVRNFQTDLGFMLQRAQNHGRGVAIRAVGGRSDWTGRARHAAGGAVHAALLWPKTAFLDVSTPSRATFDALYGLNWHTGRAKGALFGPFAD